MEQQLKKLSLTGLAMAVLLMLVPEQAFAMHIMEGFFASGLGIGLVGSVFALSVYGVGTIETDCQ
ncbi:cobalt transport protein CbiM [Photorhabdus temperata subsp. temperata M1021]|nr:cobalt transport protein CbiM [Photorhabdus temperata subsp. temperata M1021]